MNEIFREFLIETHESLAQLDLDLVTLEKDPRESQTLARVFRTLHTVKGTAGFLGLPKLQAVGHAGENLLSALRDGKLVFHAEIASSLLAVVDAIRTILAAIEATEKEGDIDCGPLIQKLERLKVAAPATSAAPASAPAAPAPAPVDVSPSATTIVPARPAAGPAPSPVNVSPTETTIVNVRPVNVSPTESTVVTARTGAGPAPSPVNVSPTESTVFTARPAATPGTRKTPPTINRPTPPKADQAPEPVEPRVSAVSDSAIRVDVGLLDKLMNLVGELVLARNQIVQFSATQDNPAYLGTVQRLNLLTTELQAGVMKTRMQPINNIWSKLPRQVRDLAVACGKQVRLEMEGQETDLDKTIIESIRDPMTHMVRNAVDHGIEPPEVRVARGKPPEGTLSLHASHEGGKVIIEIADDGGGIDPQRVRDKAIHLKLITAEQAERLSERELVNLIFLPGFSTADKVTHFSGRGVGMDVVRTNIEQIGGSVDIESRPERGTTIKMKIPLTLAIIPALTITSGGERYAIPQVSLLELLRLEGEQAQKGIEWIHGAPVYRLRGNLLPLVYLDEQLQAERSYGAGPAPEINIVVLQADDRHFGLIVDHIHDTEEIVVKPLQKQLKGINVFSGATIMGDGKVALILDVLGLAQRANVISGIRERALAEKTSAAAEPTADRQTVLLFATPGGGRMAVPLEVVARLEEFPKSALEKVGPQQVVQYRGEILSLINVAKVLDGGRRRNGQRIPKKSRTPAATANNGHDKIQVVVYASAGRQVGLIVGRIIDVVEETLVSRSTVARPGVLFSAVVQGRVTEFLDVEGLIGRMQNAEYGMRNENPESSAPGH